MAISRLVSTGIHLKMISDAKAALQLPSFWNMPSDYENEPLLLSHMMLSFFLFLGGLCLATMMFVIEMAYYKIKVRMSDSVGVADILSTESTEEETRKIEDAIIHLVEL